MVLDDFNILKGAHNIPLQTVRIEAKSTEQTNLLSLKSQIIDAELQGKYKLTELSTALMRTVDSFYALNDSKILEKQIAPNQYFSLNAQIKDDKILQFFVPELKYFDGISITGMFEAQQNNLSFAVNSPLIEYGNYHLHQLSMRVDNLNPKEKLSFEINGKKLEAESFAVNNLNLSGAFFQNTIDFNLSTRDEVEAQPKYLIAGKILTEGDKNTLQINPNEFILNNDAWLVNPNNQITFEKEGFYANAFDLTKGNASLRIQSEQQVPKSPLQINIENFKLENIAEMLKKDNLLAKGTLNGTANIQSMEPNIQATALFNLTNFEFNEIPVGNIELDAKTIANNLLQATVALSGNGNDVNIAGDYNLTNSAFDFDINLNTLPMKTLEALSMDNLSDAGGHLNGKLRLQGTTEQPTINGAIGFNDVKMTLTKTGTIFQNINDEIKFTGQDIIFNRFRLNDASNNRLVIDGGIKTKHFKSYAFDLSVKANKFKLIDAPKDFDKIMFGVFELDANLFIGGDLDLPIVNGDLSVTDQTDFTFILPQTTPTKQEREGIVEFVREEKFGTYQQTQTDTINSNAPLKGMNVTVNISVNREAKISIVLDKANGDFVKLQGHGELTGGVDPSGKTSLTGIYEVEKGAYELSVNMLRRKFNIQKGSQIIWAGDPLEADMNITAIYTTETAPLDLVQQQLAGLSSAELNQYKQRIPFHTLLKMEGELLKPEISFDITTDDKNAAVSSDVLLNTTQKLAQLRQEPSELNKQVFALLLLNRFIGENPFDTNSGTSAEAMARQSVSRILSESLNDIAGDLIAGVDLNFNLESSEDYSTGEKTNRTDLNVELSKKLLNDRLKISVGSNFGLEGEARQGEQTTNIAGDLTLDYMLSKNGRYMLRTYRKNQYQVAMQGQVIETGLGFIITIDYDDLIKYITRKKESKHENK